MARGIESPGNGGQSDHKAWISRAKIGSDRATVLDALPGRVRILGSRRFTGPGGHTGFTGSVAPAVCIHFPHRTEDRKP